MDNPNTHRPAEAKRLADKLEIRHTPRHGSWLNMAEVGLSVLRRQGLDRRLPDAAALQAEVAAWQERRNADRRPIEWRFTTDDAASSSGDPTPQS